MLDDEFGEVAKPSQLDPSHLHALAKRVGQIAGRISAFADAIDAIQKSGERRDHKLGEIGGQIQHVESEVDDIRDKMDVMLAKSSQFTPEQRKVLEDIIIGVGHRRWFSKRAKLSLGYAAGVIGFVATLYTLKDFFKAVAALVWGPS